MFEFIKKILFFDIFKKEGVSCCVENKHLPKCPECGYAKVYVCHKCIRYFRDPRLKDEDQKCPNGGVHEELDSCGRVISHSY